MLKLLKIMIIAAGVLPLLVITNTASAVEAGQPPVQATDENPSGEGGDDAEPECD